MKSKSNILLLLLLPVFIYSCNTYGKKVKVNDHIDVYIKNSATEEDAKKLGNYIDTTWKGNNNQKAFQLWKDSGIYTVKMIVDEKNYKQDTANINISFMAIQFLIESQVFKENKVRLVLTDDSFKDIKTFESK